MDLCLGRRIPKFQILPPTTTTLSQAQCPTQPRTLECRTGVQRVNCIYLRMENPEIKEYGSNPPVEKKEVFEFEYLIPMWMKLVCLGFTLWFCFIPQANKDALIGMVKQINWPFLPVFGK